MKRITFIFIALLVSKSMYCRIDTVQAKSKITDVTVFFSGAQITRQADLKMNRGKYLIMIDKLPQEINPQSIQVKKITNCKTLSVKHQLNYQNENKKSAEQLALEDKKDAQEFKIKEIKNKLKVYDMEEKLLLDNSKLSRKDDGSKISEIKEAADYYRLRLNEIKQGKLNLYSDLEKASKTIQDLYSKINELVSAKRKTYSQILITVDCEKETATDLSLSYYISSAGWQAMYDFRVDDITKPLVIVYNANVYQSSGEDWTNVNIKLSNNNPSLSGIKPELLNWYVERINPYKKENTKQGPGAIKGRVIDVDNGESIPFANVMVMKGTETIGVATTDIDGQYAIKPIQSGTYTVKVAYVGYQNTEITNIKINADITTYTDVKLKAGGQLLEVAMIDYTMPLIDADAAVSHTVSREEYQHMASKDINSLVSITPGVSSPYNIRGSRDNNTVYYVDGVRVIGTKTTNYISNSFKANVANLEYVIDIPYTIPSDGEDYSIKIKDVSVPVSYVYHAVPKLDKDVFLTAEIIDWQQLNLLSGKSSIYYQGTFTGESFIDANFVSDTLSVSLGRDKNIIVKREGNKQMYDRRVVGSNIKETVGWDITIKNNKDAKVKVVVEDQFPLTEKKSIEVELLESANAKVDEKIGKLTWEIMMEPNDKKVVNYKYSIKYPKYVNLSVD